MKQTPCPVCGSNSSLPEHTLADWQHGLGGPFHFVRCAKCNALYLNPRPADDELPSYYPASYEAYSRSSVEEGHGLRHRLRVYGLDKRCRAVTQFVTEGRLLDVGCATGDFLARMRSHGRWGVQGFEMDPVAAETARQTYDLDVHASSNLDDAPFAGETFDVVTMWDVLEHVPRPRAALAQIRRWLKPEGWLLLRTPNAGSLQARFWGRFWAGFDAPRHLVAFDPDTLTAILQAQGFSVRRIWAPSGSFALAMFSLRFWLRARGFPVGWARWVDNPPVQMLSGPLFWLADRAGGGGQMMIAAKKMKG